MSLLKNSNLGKCEDGFGYHLQGGSAVNVKSGDVCLMDHLIHLYPIPFKPFKPFTPKIS